LPTGTAFATDNTIDDYMARVRAVSVVTVEMASPTARAATAARARHL
jgi:hypothetical protein